MRRRLALIACVFLSLPAWARADELLVYVCEAGEIKAREFSAESTRNRNDLVRSGQAYWLDGRIDQPTSWAMFEGVGIWAYAGVQDLFAQIRTRTASRVLAGIAMAESGRNNRPWPWTINWAGKSLFLGSKQEAVQRARNILAAGDSMFDVGVMQVNWHFNGRRFASLEDAFEPLQNIRVADEIVQEHLKDTGSMLEAVGRYHSKTDSRKNAYLTRVLFQIDRLASNTRAQPPAGC